jgi:hypothetical protein
MEAMIYQRDTLLNDLRKNVIEVHFIKTDGTQRVMKCTLMPRLLPESYNSSVEEKNEEKDFHIRNKDVIAAWDINLGAWRSFRIDSVYYAQAVDNY